MNAISTLYHLADLFKTSSLAPFMGNIMKQMSLVSGYDEAFAQSTNEGLAQLARTVMSKSLPYPPSRSSRASSVATSSAEQHQADLASSSSIGTISTGSERKGTRLPDDQNQRRPISAASTKNLSFVSKSDGLPSSTSNVKSNKILNPRPSTSKGKQKGNIPSPPFAAASTSRSSAIKPSSRSTADVTDQRNSNRFSDKDMYGRNVSLIEQPPTSSVQSSSAMISIMSTSTASSASMIQTPSTSSIDYGGPSINNSLIHLGPVHINMTMKRNQNPAGPSESRSPTSSSSLSLSSAKDREDPRARSRTHCTTNPQSSDNPQTIQDILFSPSFDLEKSPDALLREISETFPILRARMAQVDELLSAIEQSAVSFRHSLHPNWSY